MAVKPIDLQINVSQMDHVSRAQAASKEALLLAQSQLSEKVEKESQRLAFNKVKKSSEESHLGKIDVKDNHNKNQNSFLQQDEDEEKPGEIREEDGVLTNYEPDKDSYKEEGIGAVVDLKG